MNFVRNTDPYEIGDPAFGFCHEESGVFITDPYTTSCGRFEVDPTSEYGLTAADLEWLSMLNDVYENDRRATLIAHGFYVEDMGRDWGSEFAGMYRWMHADGIQFQDHEPSYSEADAWRSCYSYAMNKY